jgi:hypothetical protein
MERLPCIFQLPATSFLRIAAPAPEKTRKLSDPGTARQRRFCPEICRYSATRRVGKILAFVVSVNHTLGTTGERLGKPRRRCRLGETGLNKYGSHVVCSASPSTTAGNHP